MPAERRKSEDAVSDFLEREREAMQAIENMAISTASEAKQTASVSKASSQQPAKPPIDWDQVEAYMLANVELDLETAKGDKDLEFLVQRYANGAPDTELWNNLLAENEKRIKEQRAKNEEYLAELRRKAADFIATIEAAEKKDYEESKRQFEEECKGNERKPWTAEEKQLNDYKRVLEIFNQIPNARRPERVIEILQSMEDDDMP